MNKQKKQLVILIGVLAVCLLSYFGISYYNDLQEQKEAEEDRKNTIYVTDFSYDEVTAFSYVYEDATYSYTKDGDNWLYDGDTTLDMEESLFTTMLYYAGCVTAEEKLTEYEELSAYGFDEPENVITLNVNGEELVLKIGAHNEMLDLYYMIVEGDNSLYLVDDAWLTYFEKTYEDLECVPEETETETETLTESESETETESSTELETSIE